MTTTRRDLHVLLARLGDLTEKNYKLNVGGSYTYQNRKYSIFSNHHRIGPKMTAGEMRRALELLTELIHNEGWTA